MSKSLANALLGEESLTPTTKFLKLPSGQVVESCGITQTIPTIINKINVLLNFYIFDIEEFDLLIVHPLMKLLDRYHEGSLNGNLRKNFNLSISLSNSTNSKPESNLKLDPMEEVMTTSLLENSHPNLEENAKHFIQEESDL